MRTPEEALGDIFDGFSLQTFVEKPCVITNVIDQYTVDITYYDNLDDFFSKNKDGKFFFFTTKARQTHSDVTYTDKSFLFFGKETKGLPEELLLEHPDECVRIPMINDARSLNLSNAVAIGTYEALRQMGYPRLQNKGQLHNYEW